MDKKKVLVMADRLAVYAIERQNGFERHQPPDGPPWSERRRFWTDAILQGMARLEGLTPDPGWMKQFDRQLEAARGCSAIETLPAREQTALIRGLSRYVSALEAAGGDRRRQIAVVGDLLEDMSTHLPWASADNGLDLSRDGAERALVRMTAQMPIRFTRILLGGDAGPHWASGFVSGAVTDAESVRQTPVYQNAVRDYPDITNWPALCTVYVGHGLSSALGTMDASGFDLEIMNQAGDSFLKEQGIRCVGGPFQMSVQTAAQAGMQYPFLQGKRPLTAGDLEVLERTGAENGWITFCLDVLAGEEAVFGRQLSSEEEDSYIQVYTSYSEHTGRVDDTLDIVIRSPGGDEWFSCSLTDETREFLKQKMDAFCVESICRSRWCRLRLRWDLLCRRNNTMEKNEITLSIDSEKMEALVFYLKKENSTVQKKMDEALRQLYEETVPGALREYLDAKSAPARPKRPPRSGQPKAVVSAPAPDPAKEEDTV